MPTLYTSEDSAIIGGTKLIKKMGCSKVRVRSKATVTGRATPVYEITMNDEGDVICTELSTGKTWSVQRCTT